MLFRRFENLIDVFKPSPDVAPPAGMLRFYAHYLKQVWPLMTAVLVVGFFAAVIEVALFSFLGQLIDMAQATDDARTFFAEHRNELLWMAAVALIIRPLVFGLHNLLTHQAINPGLTNLIRWQNHRYVLKQSLNFFQNDFAGRIAQRVMQTGPSLRDSAMQVIDALWHVVVYAGSALYLFAAADLRLIVPLLLWIVGYSAALWYFVPRIRARSAAASAARSKVMGRVVDGMKSIVRPRDVLDPEDARPLKVEQGGVRFDDVHFHYGKQGGVISGLTIDIRPGEKIGLVGPSGAGKSTLVNLLLRLYDLESGRILIDGQNVAEVSQESLRANIGVVTQDTSLLHRSIRDNLRYGKPDAGEEELWAAARKARADAFIKTLDDSQGGLGFEAMVGERGVKLSGGQRQRIAIARVLLKDAPILVLDEATSALDSEVEAAIQESLDALMEGKTVIAIAHRLSTIARMDRLVVIDKGQVIEAGTHAELIARGGLYARLWQHQTGGFVGVD